MSGDRWNRVRTIQTALRSNRSHEDQDEGLSRGMEQWREEDRSLNNIPPQYNRQSAYGNHQRGPGPHNNNGPWPNAPPPQDFSSSPYHNDYQGGQPPAGLGLQGYPAPATTSPYQCTSPQAYGLNQGHFDPQPPASYLPHNQAYQQQPMASTGQTYQGGQSAYHYTHPQNTSQPASSSFSPPLGPRPGSQNPQIPNPSPNISGQSYHPPSSRGSLSRTVTAPADLPCEHGYARD